MGSAIHPAALFQKISFHSGIELRYEKTLSEGLELDFEQASLDELFQFIDLNFSTLKAYSKTKDGKEVLTSLTVLPKGQFQSSELVLAFNPIKEAIAHKQKSTPTHAQKIYVTRIQQLEVKVQQHLDDMAQKAITREEKQTKRSIERKEQHQAERKALAKELREIKTADPEMYQRKVKIMSWKYPDLVNAIDNPL